MLFSSRVSSMCADRPRGRLLVKLRGMKLTPVTCRPCKSAVPGVQFECSASRRGRAHARSVFVGTPHLAMHTCDHSPSCFNPCTSCFSPPNVGCCSISTSWARHGSMLARWGIFGRNQRRLGHHWLGFDRSCPNLDEFAPFGAKAARIGPWRAKLGLMQVVGMWAAPDPNEHASGPRIK